MGRVEGGGGRLESSVEGLELRNPGGREVGGGSICAHCLFIVHPRLMPGQPGDARVGGKGLVLRRGAGDRNVGERVMRLNSFVVKESWA